MKDYFIERDPLLIRLSATKLYESESPSETHSRRINSQISFREVT